MLNEHQSVSVLQTPRVGDSVLVIDDEAAVRSVLVKMIERLGFQVYEADTGAAGLAALGDLSADLAALLVDMTMPQMSGVEVAQAVLTAHPGLPVVLMSGHPSEILMREHGLDGQVRFLQKPFSFAMVRELFS